MKPISVYDGVSMKRLAYLQNAFEIKYNQKTNMLWTASFTMPYSDEKNEYCKAFNMVEIWDVDGGGKDKYIGIFRIMPIVGDPVSIDGTVKYELEHVLSTLLDDTMLGWHEVGNIGTFTSQVLSYILDKQTIKRWVFGECDYAHQYLYGWQDENLLSALFSVVEPFSENDYYWSFNTTVYPWELKLKKIVEEPVTDIRYRKNLAGLERREDPSNLTTRLYCYGYGDGDNKLNIKNVNGGIPYLESPNVAKYGVLTQVWTDERFTVEESLKATGEAMLKKLEEPEITYKIDINTVEAAADVSVGDTVRVVNGLLDEYMVVQEFQKDDVSGAPKHGKIILGYGTKDLGTSLADISERQRISETYSQGAESIFMDSFYDNADNANPVEASFIVPENAVHVNEIRFTAKLTNFRAYSKATMGGGAATPTSSSGGSATPTSSSGGGGAVTSSNGGGVNKTSGSGGGTYTSTDSAATPDNYGTSNPIGLSSNPTGVTSTTSSSNTGSANGPGSHTHSISGHDHAVIITGSLSHYHAYGLPSHTHSLSIGSHYHSISIDDHTHSITLPNHTHTVNIPNHTHTVTIPNHTHAIEYGIYRGPIASQMTIYLDNVLIGTYAGSATDINLVDHMSKNANGNVMRGEHTIKIVPSSLTRVECFYQIRMFTNARGSGQY